MKAFPTHREEGMDLRDYFAAKAMQSFVIVYKDSIPVGQPMQDMAERAYLYANAMMKARDEAA